MVGTTCQEQKESYMNPDLQTAKFCKLHTCCWIVFQIQAFEDDVVAKSTSNGCHALFTDVVARWIGSKQTDRTGCVPSTRGTFSEQKCRRETMTYTGTNAGALCFS